MQIKEDVQLKDFTTFRIGGPARYFADVKSIPDLEQALSFAEEKGLEVFVLGGGSNLLVHDRGFDGLVIRPVNTGFELTGEGDEVLVRVGAGENWDETVARTVEEGLWGLENLSYIPGSTGAAPVQNIGAYGRELDEVFSHLKAYDTEQGKLVEFSKEECEFTYRSSRFKKPGNKKRFIIWEVVFRLQRQSEPNLSYQDLENYFKDKEHPALAKIRQAVIEIRKNKLPDPSEIGNAGSFFKNLLLTDSEYEELEKKVQGSAPKAVPKLQEMRQRFASDKGIKIPTAFLIDAVCGRKGYQKDGVKISDKQALVLVNESGQATSEEVMKLVREIRENVYKKTGFWITNEPDLLGFTEDEKKRYFGLD